MQVHMRFDSHLMQSEALVGNDRRPRETWVGSLSQTGFTGNFTAVPMGGVGYWVFPGIGGGHGLLSEYSVCPVGAPRVLGIDYVGRSKKITDVYTL
ncbi:hypothetical protein Hanom_Chr07g00657171 [Helianthus anomalus]